MSWPFWTVHLFVFSNMLLRTRYQIFHCSCGRYVRCTVCEARTWGLVSVTVYLWLHLLLILRSISIYSCSTAQLWKALKYCSCLALVASGSKTHSYGIPYHLLPFAARETKGQDSPIVTLQCNGITWKRSACPVLFLEIRLLDIVPAFTFLSPKWGMVPLPPLFLLFFQL